MKRSEFAGTGKVCVFTLTQQLKNRANIISLVILLLFCLASVPVMSLTGGGSFQLSPSAPALPGGIWLRNETPLDIAAQTAGTALDGVPVHTGGDAPDGAVTVTLTGGSDGYHIAVSGEDFGDLSPAAIAAAAQGWLRAAQYASLGISAAQAARLDAPLTTASDSLSGYLSKAYTGVGLSTRFLVIYAYAVVVLILSTYAASYIVRIVVEEKASRLVETLMVSVQPLALILGKILAMMIYIFGMFLAMGLCIGISWLGTSRFGDVGAAAGVLTSMGLDLSSLRLDAWTIVIALISLLLAYGGFSLLAGLAGTCCSRTEETDSAVSVVMFTVLGGYLVSCFTGAASSHTMGVILALCPVVNVFCAPVQYTLGTIGAGWLVVSWLEQVLLVAGLAWLTARVYRQLLLSRGARIKLRQLLSMAKKKEVSA